MISNYQKIIAARLDRTGRLEITASFDSKERLRFFDGRRLLNYQPASFDDALLLTHTNKGTLYFLDHHLQPMGMLNLPVVFGYGYLKNSGHFRRQRLFVKSERSDSKTILLSGNGQEAIVHLEPLYVPSSMTERAGVAAFYLGIILISILAYSNLKKGEFAQLKIKPGSLGIQPPRRMRFTSAGSIRGAKVMCTIT